MKRTLVVVSFAMCLAVPAQAVGPLATILIGYVKQALKEKLVAYAKDQAMGLVGESLADVPRAAMLGMVPGMAGFAPRPGMPKEAAATLKASGFYDTKTEPLTDAEWEEYEQTVTMMAKAAGAVEDDVPDVAHMRSMMAGMPQMSGCCACSCSSFAT